MNKKCAKNKIDLNYVPVTKIRETRVHDGSLMCI